jgi:hypothetical protein
LTIYIDNDYKCHVSDDGTFRAVETDIFNGKCDVFVEGYRFVPSGEAWTREDGVTFSGEMFAPWKDYSVLDQEQRKYEQKQLADMREALALLGVAVDE